MEENANNSINAIFIGNTSVGKTSLICRIMRDEVFDDIENTTSVHIYQKEVISPSNKKVKLNLYDSPGQEIFQSIIQQFYYKCNVALICFDYNDKNSLDIEKYADAVHLINENCLIFLVATKIDLFNQTNIEEIENFMNSKSQDFRCFKTSSAVGDGIEELINEIADIDINNKPNVNPQEKTKCCIY